MKNEPREGDFQVNGLRLRYLEWGEQTKPPVLLLHGFLSQASIWSSLARQLSRNYHVIALNQRGHGNSDWSSEGDYSIDDHFTDLVCFLEELELREVILVGHSMGGRNALFYAVCRPERIKKLADQGYLNYEWREGATLTPKGERIALNVLRKHRLIETFLVKMAGYSLDEIHDEACRIEHAISDRLADRLDELLAFPSDDPHGHPIPTVDGTVRRRNLPSLCDVQDGETVTIRQVSDWKRDELRYIRELGLVPGVRVVLLNKAPFDGPLTIQIGESVLAISRDIAGDIGVEPISDPAGDF